MPEDKKDAYIEYSEDRKPFPYIAFRYQNSVLAKVNIIFFVTTTEIRIVFIFFFFDINLHHNSSYS